MSPESQEHFLKLESLLNDIIKVYRHLLSIVRKEREILISSDLTDLNENNRTKEAMLLKAKALEDERIQCCRELALFEGLEPDNTRLQDFAHHFGGPAGEKLLKIHSVLELLLKRVRDHNQHNEVLVRSALNSVTGAMNDIKESVAPKKTYKRGGNMKEASPESGQLVRKEV